MFHLILTIFTLIVSLFGLYAFIKLMTTKTASPDFVGMKEMETLNPELKQLYRKYVVDQIMPAFMKIVNGAYEATRKSISYSKIDAEAKKQTDAMLVQINAMREGMIAELKEASDTTEAFQSMVQGIRTATAMHTRAY